MKRKIVGITLMLILISSSFTLFANAGSEKNPELEDETGEVLSYVDIVSVWFFEKPDEPENLYINMKIKNLKLIRPYQVFTVFFEINNESYCVVLGKGWPWPTDYFELTHFISNDEDERYDINGNYRKLNGIISWKIPKDLIGNPNIGDKVTDINADSMDDFYILLRYFPLEITKGITLSFLTLISAFSKNDLYELYHEQVQRKFDDYWRYVCDYVWDMAYTDSDYIIQY